MEVFSNDWMSAPHSTGVSKNIYLDVWLCYCEVSQFPPFFPMLGQFCLFPVPS